MTEMDVLVDGLFLVREMQVLLLEMEEHLDIHVKVSCVEEVRVILVQVVHVLILIGIRMLITV